MKIEELIMEIHNCPNVDEIYSGVNNPCSKIVNFQRTNNVELSDFKGPEAWNGQLDKSKILIISSNPGIGDKELIPTKRGWKTNDIIDFYQNRFSSKNEWVRNNGGKRKDGTYSPGIANWSQTKNRMKYLFGEKVKIGSDYTLLELVHCKSTKEHGVNNSIAECSNRFFEKIMNISPAKVLIITGKHAIDFFCAKYSITKKTENSGFGLYSPILINGIQRIIAFLPHTNNYGRRKAEYFINDDEKKQMNNFLT